MKKVLISGSCGFIGSNFIRQVLAEKQSYQFVSIDKLVSPNNYRNILPNHKLYIGDIADTHFIDMVFRLEKPNIIIHEAAESHVDSSIKHALPFMHSNILGTQVMVDMSLKHGVERFIYAETDEVYGQLSSNDSPWTENSPLNPRNPYSASKAAGGLLVRAASETHGLNYMITRSSNNYGPRQVPRNLVPKVITCVLQNQPIPIHGEGKEIREWIYVEDHCTAITTIMNHALNNQIFNIGSGIEKTNLEMIDSICELLGRGKELKTFVVNRKGHDFRYSVDCTKLHKLGWSPRYTFEQGLEKCVKWYIDNPWYFDNENNNIWIHD